MLGSGYENCPEFGVLGGVILIFCKNEEYCSSGAFQVAPAAYYIYIRWSITHCIYSSEETQLG
jgi:hypothetical protein